MGSRRCPCTFSKTRPEVASSKYAAEPFTRGVGVGEGVGVGVVGTGMGVSVGVAAAKVGVVGKSLVFCPEEKRDEKKAPMMTTSTTIKTSKLIKRVRCFTLHLYFYLDSANRPMSLAITHGLHNLLNRWCEVWNFVPQWLWRIVQMLHRYLYRGAIKWRLSAEPFVFVHS